jgi:AcrR family transcriptional regulator
MTELMKRPTASERREAMLQAAADVFFEQGYAATSIDAIIERLGGSKRAIYAEFGNKEGLFSALVSHNADIALTALEGQIDGGDHDIRQTLLALGHRLMAVYFSPALLGVFRAIMAEAQRFPELARTFYDKGPGRAALELAGVLQEAGRRGEIHVEDHAMAASHFVGMLRDNLHLRVVLGLNPAPSQAEIEKHVVSAVKLFLNGVSWKPPRGVARGGKKSNATTRGGPR